MKLTDAQLAFYVDDVIAFKPEHREKYQPQVDYLVQTLTNSMNADSALGVRQIVRAGSWAKGTALRPRDGFDLDIDLVVYLDVSDADASDIAKLHGQIVGLLRKTYSQKDPSDFVPSKKTVGITFRTSGLKVDL